MTKKPSKDYFQIKEKKKIASEVFDKETLLTLSKIMKKGIVETIDYPVSTGKEANVFRATAQDGKYVAIKIYKIETTHFFKRKEYIEGDPRFEGIIKDEKGIILAFARKEYKNLELCENAGVDSPIPLFLEKNVVVMSFLGEEGLAYPTLHMVGPQNNNDLDDILDNIKKMYTAGLVHADISEYNIMMAKKPYFIDFGQGVILKHPKAQEFLKRDVETILKYFAKHGDIRDPKKVLEWIKK